MTLIDLNVLLDVLQKREPHLRASARVLDYLLRGPDKGAFSAHAITTIHYVIGKYNDNKTANQAVDWLFRNFHIVAVGRSELLRARALGWDDFEDAVVVAAAETAKCSAIVTRNVKDFADSPVPPFTPEEFLATRKDA